MISNLAGIVETITGYLQNLTQQGYLTLDYIFYIGLGIQLVLVIFFLIKSSFSYELRLDRTLDKLNKWLYYNQYIDENNLIAFNKRMKKAPKLLKYHWQQYMLYRENDPSHYMSNYHCIDKPLHTSSFTSNIKNLMSICWCLSILTFGLSLTTYALGGQTNIGFVLLNALLTPLSIILLSTFFSILLRSWQNSNLAGLYQNFHLFNRYIDKACTTLPEYIDFEILFTKDEIRRGIPVLNEYLEKRARQEQKELENAMLNTVDHEEYDFDELGIDGSQILDRAMKETEIFLNQRQRSLSEIQQLESEIESLKRNYENNQKEYQRKMQASKENVDRLRKQQEESTNRIESNYIKKQQSDEIKKQEQLEKDYESTTLRFNQEYNTISSEIDVRRAELAERHSHVEDAMKAEYKTFSNKLYKSLNEDLEQKNNEEKQKLVEEKEVYAQELQQNLALLEDKQNEINKLHQILNAYGINVGDHGEFYDEALRIAEQNIKYGNKNVNSYQNYNTQEQIINEEYSNQEQFEQEPQSVYEENTEIDEQSLYQPEEEIQDQQDISEEQSHEEQDVQIEEETVEAEAEEQTETEQVEAEEDKDEQSEPVYDEYGGYYDSEGYYRYKNGTYYDPEGNYFDEFGGHYDKDGNYFPPAENQEEIQTDELAEQEQTHEEVLEDNVDVELNEGDDENIEAQMEDLQEEAQQEEPKFEFNDTIVEPDDKEETDSEAQEFENENQEQEQQVQDEVVEQADVQQDIQEQENDNKNLEEIVEEKPKAKRGRPRKIVSEEEQKPKQPGKRGRPRKVVNENEQPKTTAKRGRPKKESSETIEQKTVAKRGRPKKQTVNKETKPKTTAKRGRPKKESSEVAEQKTVAKRGRPKKQTDNKEVKPKTTAKRGRPKKSLSQSKPSSPKKGRGRPRKDTVSKSELFDELEKLNIQIQQENEKLQQQQAELNQKIDETLSKIENNDDNNNDAI